MRSCKWISVLAGVMVLLLVGVREGSAQTARRTSVTVTIAVDPSISGTSVGAGPAVLNGVVTTFTETNWADSHSDKSPLFNVLAGYEVVRRTEVIGGFEYGRAGADLVTVGSVPSGPLSASLDAYQFWGLEGGVRFGLTEGHGVYGLVTGGFRHVSDMSAVFTAPGFAATRAFYDGKSVPSFGVAGGFLFNLEGPVRIGFEVGVKYTGELQPAAGSAELGNANAHGERWSLPIGLVLRF